MKGGGAGAHLAGIVYEPRLTLDLPRDQSGGTALNALAHCAEALYVAGHNPEGDREALDGREADRRGAAAGARRRPTTSRPAPGCSKAPQHAGAALGSAGLGARSRDGPGARRPLRDRRTARRTRSALPPALRFNEPVAAEAIGRFGEALGVDDPAARVEELARASGFTRLRELGVPEDELDEVAAAVVERAGAKANPRPASPAEVAELLRSIW